MDGDSKHTGSLGDQHRAAISPNALTPNSGAAHYPRFDSGALLDAMENRFVVIAEAWLERDRDCGDRNPSLVWCEQCAAPHTPEQARVERAMDYLRGRSARARM